MNPISSLGDIATLYDSLHKTPKSYLPDGYPMVRVTDISRGFIDVAGVRFVDKDTYEEFSKKHKPCIGDIIYARVGNTFGKSSYVDRSLPICLGQNLVCITADESKIDPFFLYSFLNSEDAQGQMNALVAGGAQPTISLKSIKEIKVPLPSLNVQFEISQLLKNYDNLIENNNRRIAILEEMAQSLYREWFVKFRFPEHDQCQMVESSLGLIPEGWAVGELKDVCQLTMGQSPKSEFYNQIGEGLPFYQGVKDYGKRFPSVSVWCSKPTRIAKIGDILFSVRAPVGRLNIANSQLAIGRGLSAISHKNGYQSFLFQQLKSIFSREDLIGNGAIFNAVTKKDMEQIQLICPPETVLKMFAVVLDPIFRQLEVLYIKNDNLKAQRDLLLPKLISGQIDLSQAEQATA